MAFRFGRGHGIIRAPVELWEKLDSQTKENLIRHVKETRSILPNFSNWLLFSAMVEAALFKIGVDYDELRVDYALRQHEQWYLGDGMYSDGPNFSCDYYTSFVILPMLIDVTETFLPIRPEFERLLPVLVARAQRQAIIQERLIAPDGTFPALGRSITYRCGAFQILAQLVLRDQLPDQLSYGQVRSALTAVIRRTIGAPGTFDEQGWLTIGLAGSQPSLGEVYISVASTYLCSVGLLPLGLPRAHPFWQSVGEQFTGEKIWAGIDILPDQALLDKRILW